MGRLHRLYTSLVVSATLLVSDNYPMMTTPNVPVQTAINYLMDDPTNDVEKALFHSGHAAVSRQALSSARNDDGSSNSISVTRPQTDEGCGFAIYQRAITPYP